MSVYAKFIAALIGAAVTAALAVVPPSTTLWDVLTILAAVLTAAAVYIVPNKATTP